MTKEYSFGVVSADDIHYEEINYNLYMLLRDFYCCISEGENKVYLIKIQRGFIWNGTSIPKIFSWFLPNFDTNNNLYNVAALVHDALYASKLWEKLRSDDLYRCILRDSGISRFKAGVADKALIFAKKHYGDDEYNCSHLVSIS